MPKFTRTFYVPGDSLGEWLAIQVPANTNDRLSIVPAPLGKSPNALRVQVRDGDVAVNSQGQPIPGGWRAEGVGPTEVASPNPARYTWSTMLDPAYPVNATGTDGKPIWQVITQWHQGDQDVGGPPPIAFIIVGDQILLHLHRSDPQNPANSIEVGQFPVANGLARGSWHDFQMDVRWDLTNGWVTVWHNGQLMQHHGPIQTLFPQQQNPGAAGSTYLKMGLYRKAVPTATAGDFVLYHDEVQRFDASFAPVYQQGDPGTGIGGYDLARPSDRIFAFDYNRSGRQDHLVLHRPGTGTIWILRNLGGRFAPIYQQGDPGSGIGGYDLARASDRVLAFDYDGSGRQDHLVLYRPGTGTIWILR